MRDFFKTTEPVHFVFPIDGDFLNRYDGCEDADGLHLTVRLKAPFDAELYVNETPCTFDRETGEYSCEVNITHYRDTLVAVDKKNGYRAEIVVFRAYDPTKKTYFTVDDCIIFLYDLAMEPEKYESLFDHPFLNVFKTAHDRYGTVRNVVDFGVFVDIGVHQDGLVHISQVCDKFIKHPSEVVRVGDVVKVSVLEVDEKKHRIGLSMRQVKE